MGNFNSSAPTPERRIDVDLTADGGVKKRVVREGSGPFVQEGVYVQVHYTGALENGIQFDSSRDRGLAFTFQVGSNQVVDGWNIAVKTMRVNERSIIEISPLYGYGDKRVGKIPPNSTLIFEIEVLRWYSGNPKLYSAFIIGLVFFVCFISLILTYFLIRK